MPQAPQDDGSVCRLRQVFEQFVRPVMHVATHAPFEQTCPLPHTVPQPPQLLRSFCVFTSQPFAALPSQLA